MSSLTISNVFWTPECAVDFWCTDCITSKISSIQEWPFGNHQTASLIPPIILSKFYGYELEVWLLLITTLFWRAAHSVSHMIQNPSTACVYMKCIFAIQYLPDTYIVIYQVWAKTSLDIYGSLHFQICHNSDLYNLSEDLAIET